MSTSQQTDPLIGRLVDGRYRVRARIARGGMATVYVATDLRLERRVALKVMHGHLSDDTVFQSRFIQEARAAARLADPHVVNVFDQGQDGDMAYLVMEYLPGITLRELLREQRRLTVPQTVTIMDAILSGLSAAHRAGIVHRDVKPENVLLAEDGRIKIGDFGLARATTANTATGSQLLGTIAYLAPELVTRGTADARSDIYSLGIMLYEMLVGEQPYKGEQPMQIAFQHATDSVPRPSVKNPGVPEPLDELVLWSTERSPDDRPADAREMLERLRDIEHDLGITPVVTRTGPIGVIADEGLTSDELTAVLPVTAPTTTVDDVDNAARLRRATKRRSAKGGWLVALVLLLSAAAAGVGWWFGSGPGSMVAVPQVASLSFEEAQTLLADSSLEAREDGAYSLDVEAGRAIGTDPEAGARVDKDTVVTVVMSLGPQQHEVQSLTGMSVDEARGILIGYDIAIAEPDQLYFTDAADGTVINLSIAPRDGGDAIGCRDGCTAFAGDTATLSVSVGPVPGVRGMSVGDATSTLNGVDLQVSGERIEDWSSEIAEGGVLGIADRPNGGSWRPGETVTLIVSKGPQPVAVPDVIGMSIREAVDAINGAGLQAYTDVPDTLALWDVYKVREIAPEVGTLQRPGTQITITGIGL